MTVITDSAGVLAGRNALVTGASRGIGLAIATALVREGARTWMLARSASTLSLAARALGALAVPLACDVSDAGAVSDATSRIAEATSGAPDIVVNNAGLFPLATLASMNADEFAKTMAVNVVAPFLLVRAFLPAMLARGRGHIVTIGSVADRTVFPENGAYAASKYAQRAMHEALRQEVRGAGVRASLVSPGPTDTAIWDPIDPDRRDGFPPRAAMLSPDAVGDAVLWLVTRPANVNVEELRLSRA